MYRKLATTLCILLAATLSTPVAAEIVVIVHPDNPIEVLTRTQVVDIYMGRITHFPNGNAALPVDLPPDSPVRVNYYQKLVNKSVAQVNSFWARLMFTGRASPPLLQPDVNAVLSVVMRNRDAIAYIDSEFLDAKVKVVFRLP